MWVDREDQEAHQEPGCGSRVSLRRGRTCRHTCSGQLAPGWCVFGRTSAGGSGATASHWLCPQHICRWVWACCPRDALAELGAQRDALCCPRAMRFTTADIVIVSCVLLWSLWRVVYPSPFVLHSLESAPKAGMCFLSALTIACELNATKTLAATARL